MNTGNEYYPRIIKSFLDNDLYKFSMCGMFLKHFSEMEGEYEFFDRSDRVYPDGFAEQLWHQIELMKDVYITDIELEYLFNACPWLYQPLRTFLRGYRYDTEHIICRQDEQGHLILKYHGPKLNKIFWEVPMMAIISELYYKMTGLDTLFDYDEYYKYTYEKGIRLLEAGCVFSDFGTRRRASFKAQEVAVRALHDAYKSRDWSDTGGRFLGSSNPYFCMTIDPENMKPAGTIAHEASLAIGAIYGISQAHKILSKAWINTYNGECGIYLPDSFSVKTFTSQFEKSDYMAWSGLRVDSGENMDIFKLFVSLYEENSIRPETKQVIFSNALDVDSAIDIHKKVDKKVMDGYGIGTHFTNDFIGLCKKLGRPITLLISMDSPDRFLRGKELKLEALNMVIKMVAARLGVKDWWHKIAKLSFDPSKATGSPEAIAATRAQIPENSETLNY